MAFLTPQQIEKQQAESEGYQQGPQPEINNPNANTQDALGNTVVQTPVAAPYYPGATETPNLQLTLTNIPVNVAENMVLIDAAIGVVPIIQPKLQIIDTNVPQTVSIVVPTTANTMYDVPVYLSSRGDGAGGTTVTATLTWTGVDGITNTVVLVASGTTSNVELEEFPILALAGSTVTVSTAFNSTAFHYDVSARFIQL